MEKIVTVTFDGPYGETYTEDAIVEYVTLLDEEDGLPYKEIINIFLPDGISQDQHDACKLQAVNEFNRRM